jgi:hypothetical protein
MSTMMRRDAWRAINVIAWLCTANGGGEQDYPTVRRVLECDVDPDALVWLYESMGYASAVNGHDGVGMGRCVKHGQPDGGRHDPTIVQACLTPAGVHWWHNDPYQKTLWHVRIGSGRLRLSEAGLDGEAMEGLHDGGLVEVIHTPTGEPATHPPSYTKLLAGTSGGQLYTVQLTSAGRSVSGYVT